jgi:zinc transporter ZupT
VDHPASLNFVSVWVPIIAAVLGALVGTIGGAVGPVIAGWLKERLYGRRDNLLDYMLS